MLKPSHPELEISPEGDIMGWLCPPSNHIACYKGASPGSAPPPIAPPTTTDAVDSIVDSAARRSAAHFGFQQTILTKPTSSINSSTHDPTKKKNILGG